LCSLSQCQRRQYHFVSSPLNWTSAQRYCRKNHTDLATIDNKEELDRLLDTTGQMDGPLTVKMVGPLPAMDSSAAVDTGQAWIGLYTGDTEQWYWSLSDTDFYSEGETQFRNWKTGEPVLGRACAAVTGGAQDQDQHTSAAQDSAGQWFTANCSLEKPFICYTKRSTDSSSYTLVQEPRNWTEAQRLCRENYTDLVSVRNQRESITVSSTAQNESVWIGLFSDFWKWSDKANSSFRNWENFQLNNFGGQQNCTTVYTNNILPALGAIMHRGKWNNLGCEKNLPFFCYDADPILVRENKSWDEAQQYCRTHHTDLVSIFSDRDQNRAQLLARNSTTPYVWLGLRLCRTLGFWFWVGGRTPCYTRWEPGTQGSCGGGGGRAGALQAADGQWESLARSEKLNFLCAGVESELTALSRGRPGALVFTWGPHPAILLPFSHASAEPGRPPVSARQEFERHSQAPPSPLLWLGGNSVSSVLNELRTGETRPLQSEYRWRRTQEAVLALKGAETPYSTSQTPPTSAWTPAPLKQRALSRERARPQRRRKRKSPPPSPRLFLAPGSHNLGSLLTVRHSEQEKGNRKAELRRAIKHSKKTWQAAEAGGETSDDHSALQWLMDGQAFTQGGLSLQHNQVIVPKSGLYFVYTQASFRTACSPGSEALHLSHSVTRFSSSYQAPRPLLRAVRTATHERHWHLSPGCAGKPRKIRQVCVTLSPTSHVRTPLSPGAAARMSRVLNNKDLNKVAQASPVIYLSHVRGVPRPAHGRHRRLIWDLNPPPSDLQPPAQPCGVFGPRPLK
ncbi:MRC2 protein, partial [Atractosteus spatula]|nr:MRC2 protein [Atractosteus spatula]